MRLSHRGVTEGILHRGAGDEIDRDQENVDLRRNVIIL
jgi:hypothetical protein